MLNEKEHSHLPDGKITVSFMPFSPHFAVSATRFRIDVALVGKKNLPPIFNRPVFVAFAELVAKPTMALVQRHLIGLGSVLEPGLN